MEYYFTLLHDWQELAGAFLGSSLAVILSGIGYLITKWIESGRERKETMRRIEVGTTYSLNTTHTEEQKLRFFVTKARDLVAEVRGITEARQFAMQTRNFPTISGIYLDDEITRFRINSYYLHNKLLWIHAGTQEVNGTLSSLKEHYDRILKLNETMITLMTTTGPNPLAQRIAYAENLELFANEIERFCDEELPKGVKTILQTKVYNEKVRQPFLKGKFARWKYEGINFKYFRTHKDFKKFTRNLDSIDRIDTLIEPEVHTALEEMKRRAESL